MKNFPSRFPSRGVRNNNPFNIVISNNQWIGKMKKSSDPKFEQFCDIRYGIRAGLIILRSYIRIHRLFDVESIISRFAPSSENNTKAYISYVENFLFSTGFTSDNIKFGTCQFYTLCRAILKYESNYDISIVNLTEIKNHYNL